MFPGGGAIVHRHSPDTRAISTVSSISISGSYIRDSRYESVTNEAFVKQHPHTSSLSYDVKISSNRLDQTVGTGGHIKGFG